MESTSNIQNRSSGIQSRQMQKRELTITPRTDIVETEGELRLYVDLPGAAKESLNVEIKENVLTVTARANWDSPDKLQLQHREFQESCFRRAFALSDGFDSEKVEAALKDGVLRLTLPKTERLRPRRITVKSE